jgi:D-alanyl-D-alanine carboxypeptidase (penicillin-binding protein 5/6)
VPLERREVYRRRRVVVFAALGVVLVVAFYLPLTLLAPLKAAPAVAPPPTVLPGAAAQLSLPSYGGTAVAAVGFDGVLGQSGSTAPLPMASITKVVTSLVVLQAKPLAVGAEGPSVTMTAADVALYNYYRSADGQVVTVKAGVAFTEHELLELSLIHSANNYAASLALWAFGSMDAYLTAAKAWVTAHHLSSITITDPTGLDPTDVASTTDLITLGELALADPVIAPIVATKSIDIHDVGTLTNTNMLLGSLGVDGIKTGTLNGAGSNLLFAADHTIGSSTVTIVGVVLGGSTHDVIDADIGTLLTGVFEGFHEVRLATKGQVFASYTTEWGQKVTAVAEKSATMLVWSSTPITGAVAASAVTTGSKGEPVGRVTFRAGTRTVTVPLGLATKVVDPGPGWRLSHPGLIVGSP